MKKYLFTFFTALLVFFSANAEVDPDHRTAAPAIMVLPSLEPGIYMLRYLVYFTPREGNVYYRWMNHSDGQWSEWSECGKVVVFNTIGTFTVEAYAKKPGKPESAHLSTTFTTAYTGMSVAPGIRMQIDKDRGYYVSMTSLYDYDIYYRWRADEGEWNKWLLYREEIPFTEVGKYTIEAESDNDYVSVSFEVDRSQVGGAEFYPGDVNMDGVIDVSDITALISYVLGNNPEPFDVDLANLNVDDRIDVADVTALIQMALNNN